MKAPAFQFYPAEFLADENVVLMSNQEIGCYVKLMCYCWREGSIPSEVDKIARLCGEDGSAMAQLWPSLKPCFTEPSDSHGRLIHLRLDAEREKQRLHSEERSKSGKEGAKARWDSKKRKHSSAMPKPLAEPMAENGSSSSSSSSFKESNKEGANGSHQQRELDDKKWLEGLTVNAAYQGIDVLREHAKMLNYCRENSKVPSRKRFINWLNRADKPMQAQPGLFPASPRDIQAQIRAIQDRIDTHPANQCSIYYNPNHSAEEKADLAHLRANLKELKSK